MAWFDRHSGGKKKPEGDVPKIAEMPNPSPEPVAPIAAVAERTARLADPERALATELWVDGSYRYLMVYTADQVSAPQRRRTSVAIEPMTCPPDAFRSGADLSHLEPGESWHGSWGLRSLPTESG